MHADENRHFRGATVYWLLTLASKQVVYSMNHYPRGIAAAQLRIGNGKAYVVTVDFSGYNRIDSDRRQLCWHRSTLRQL